MTDLSRFNAALNIIHHQRESAASSADKQTQKQLNTEMQIQTKTEIQIQRKIQIQIQMHHQRESAASSVDKQLYTKTQIQTQMQIQIQYIQGALPDTLCWMQIIQGRLFDM